MSTVKISYNGSEISSADETTPVGITYNGAQIAVVSDGETKTLPCSGKYMSSDVVIGSKTLTCAHQIMAGDVSVEAQRSGETWEFVERPNVTVNMTFTVGFVSDGVTYNALKFAYSSVTKPTAKITKSISYRYDTTYSTAYQYTKTTTVSDTWKLSRTITLDEPASGTLLSLLNTYATKIG